jgi:mannose-6-phosphate isomerase-like protein (cupin superfamily)
MDVTRLGDARPYEAPNHFGCVALRLQGWDVSDTKSFWVGLSHFLPLGGCEFEAGGLEKVYVVIEGEITIRTDDGETTLRALDSCHIPAGEARSVENRTNLPASMMVVMPYPSERA